jgi:hypothetical protein
LHTQLFALTRINPQQRAAGGRPLKFEQLVQGGNTPQQAPTCRSRLLRCQHLSC